MTKSMSIRNDRLKKKEKISHIDSVTGVPGNAIQLTMSHLRPFTEGAVRRLLLANELRV